MSINPSVDLHRQTAMIKFVADKIPAQDIFFDSWYAAVMLSEALFIHRNEYWTVCQPAGAGTFYRLERQNFIKPEDWYE